MKMDKWLEAAKPVRAAMNVTGAALEYLKKQNT